MYVKLLLLFLAVIRTRCKVNPCCEMPQTSLNHQIGSEDDDDLGSSGSDNGSVVPGGRSGQGSCGTYPGGSPARSKSPSASPKSPFMEVDSPRSPRSLVGSPRSPACYVEQGVEEPLPKTRIYAEIPKITTDLGKGIHFVKLPNFLSVEPRPFDPNTYEEDDEGTHDEEGRARLKLKVENTIRWRERFNNKGEFVKESNARFVDWSDGSYSLHLGSEIFNVYKQPLQGDHNHLFIRQGTGLQGRAVFRTRLSFRPYSTESFTHRKITLSPADRLQKTQGIKVISQVGLNPEAHREQMMKMEEDKLRASTRREGKQRRVRKVATDGRGCGLSASYLDDDDNENVISLSAIKNRYKRSNALGQKYQSRANVYPSDDEEGSDIEDRMKARKLEKAKTLKMSDDEEDDAGDAGPSTSRIGDHIDHSGGGGGGKGQ